MAFIPTPNTALAQIVGTKDGIPVANDFHFRSPAVPGTVDFDELADAIQAKWVTDGLPLLPTDVNLSQVIVTDISTQTGYQATVGFPAGSIGELSGAPMPNNVSKAFQLNTGFRGRAARGRIHWMGFSEAVVEANIISTIMLDNIDLFLTNFQAEILSNTGWILCVTSFTLNKVPRETGVNYDVTGFSIASNRTGSMAGRLR